MDDQLPQAPPSAAHARPQQPADSPAAALPFETLQHILQLAREDSSPPDAARTLKSFSCVCKLWHDVARQAGAAQFHVANSQQAELLTRALLASPTAEWRESVCSAVIQIEPSLDAALDRRSRCIGRLLLALPRLERLYLELQDSLVTSASEHRPLGELLPLALRGLNALKHFHLELGANAAQADITPLCLMLGSWPLLRSFTAPSLDLDRLPWNLSDADLVAALPRSLRSISLDVVSHNNSLLLLQILVKSSAIQALQLGPVHEDALLRWNQSHTQNLGALLEEVAPRLRHLDLRDGPRPSFSARIYLPDHLVNIINRLTSIRTLAIGLGGIPSDSLFPLLGRLGTLVDLSVIHNRYLPPPHAYRLDSQAVVAFLAKSQNLRSLRLPASYCVRWGAEGQGAVESAATAAGVGMRFA